MGSSLGEDGMNTGIYSNAGTRMARKGRGRQLIIESQFARVVKGVDLRSTGGNSAWVRAPQLTC